MTVMTGYYDEHMADLFLSIPCFNLELELLANKVQYLKLCEL